MTRSRSASSSLLTVTFAVLALLALRSFARATPFETGSGDPVRALLGPSKIDAAAVAREVRDRGFFAGEALGAGDCAACHADIAAQWAQSAHRFASFNNPYYSVSFEAFQKERGGPAARFCAGCHDPLLLVDGAVDHPIDRTRKEAQAGIVCLVCHSIDNTDLLGNGGFHAKVTPVPYKGPGHGARLRPAILAESRLCGACHKVGLTTDVTHDRWLRGQDDYDPWHASAVSGHGAPSIYRPPSTERCQDCHMPFEPAVLGDAAAKAGPGGIKRIRSHRFLGANTALPSLRGDSEMLKRTTAFLSGKVALDVAAFSSGVVDVILRSNGVGHRFPGGTMDSNEVWLEVEAFDGAGKVIARSGGRGPGGTLEEDAHLVRVQAVDVDGRPLARRDPQHARGTAYDNALGPSDPRAVRFLVPATARRVRARLLYRKFTPAYAELACVTVPDRATHRLCVELPIVEVARAEEDLAPPPTSFPPGALCGPALGAPAGAYASAASPDLAQPWRRLLNHGLALADALVEQAPEALPYLECARTLAPERVEPLLGLARLALALGQTDDAVHYTELAERIAPDHPAALLLRARALYEAYRLAPALAPARRLLEVLPDDRAALALAARVCGVNHQPEAALAAAERLLGLDPESEEGHYQRMLALRDLHRDAEAAEAETRYLQHRVAGEIDLELRRRFRALEPARADEDVPVHTHRLRPVSAR